jgi:hypothetical protein
MNTPISIEHLRRKLGEMKADMDAGKLRHGDYDQRLARLIQEMRERKLDADRPAISTTLDELLADGTITPAVRDHVSRRLGLS